MRGRPPIFTSTTCRRGLTPANKGAVMPDFSIKIVPVGFGAGFQPDLPGSAVGDPLYCAPSSLITWANQTNDTHQIEFDDNSFTSNEILPELSSKTEYVAPSSQYGSLGYHCALHSGETGTIFVQPVVNMDPLSPVVAAFAALAIAALSAFPAGAQTTQQQAPSAQIQCLPEKQPLVKV